MMGNTIFHKWIRVGNRLLLSFSSALFFLVLMGTTVSYSQSGENNRWQAGTAKAIITPEKPMWLAGYGHRDKPSQGTYHDLWAKVLVMEDQRGNKGVLVTSDILGFPQKMSERIRTKLYQNHGVTKAQVILNSTHTHSGPVLEEALYDIYPLDPEQLNLVSEYSNFLEQKIIELVGQAMQNMKPVRLYAANGVSRFQVNRRNNAEREVHQKTALEGPIDHAVPVIKVENEEGGLETILFGYACHPTVLDHYYWSGDYPGYAQLELEKYHPGVTAMFFQGAAGDQNPIPRRSVPLAKQYGRTLAAAVDRVLEEEMAPLPATFRLVYREIDLALESAPSEEELSEMAQQESGYMQRWAKRILAFTQSGGTSLTSYPYPLQIWQIGSQLLFNMGGEVTVAYANRLKADYGHDIFVMAYSNDVMGYIPSEIILKEGGYEGYSSQMVYGLPAKWKPGLEKQILETFDEMAAELSISKVYE
ncbi:neutral/alkaline non-lysosomal ceramidase N-terminal domain-containing protein [Negadavirga shengliensis]|uniref:Neutral ceramidase n=1 Tax=Negadavirga shengliensis TaxID=1389218 RepID=A0ABV9T2V0_9BACT